MRTLVGFSLVLDVEREFVGSILDLTDDLVVEPLGTQTTSRRGDAYRAEYLVV